MNSKAHVALKMDREIVDFLSQHGSFPSIKDREDEIINAEERLANKLVQMQAGLEAKFIQALRDRGSLPSNNQQQMKVISDILDIPFNEMKQVISDQGVDVAEIGRQLTFDDMVQQGLEISATGFNENVKQELAEKIYTFSDDTFNRIQGDFAKTLSSAYEDGIGIDDAARRLRTDFKGLRDHRLKNIARTEIQGAQNEGSQRTMEEVGTEYKQWITVNDGRVRGNDSDDMYDHTVLHGEVVKVNESFSNGLKYPGERSGAMGQWINCRCRERPYIPRRTENIITTPYYPSAA
ncbi:phage minor head protein [Virgibacillus sp. CBA3643]|uniref:phage head morphogenesis protein n=1 Tax=Virgibacillus sp. CBA3643 TaxID=2942278 RepID=UPI0035A38FB9